ncbi:MOSC domain-containing protein [Ideonella sp.]|uniref:MOSC domain-containing protein n=1 Tax=Ideonella sp. TaxID=1929293 RepID=UPI0035B3C469
MPDHLEARVDALFIYPVKACGALRVERLDIAPSGLIAGDREWAVVDEKGEVTWQGAHPRLALVRPTLDGGVLRLTAPGEAVVLAAAERPRPVQMWNDSVKMMETFAAFDAGDAAAALLQQTTGAPLRLVRFGPEALARRGIYPLHLLNAASLGELNAHLAGQGLAEAEALRFRPNLLLGAAAEPLLPFIEEQVTRLHGGEGERRWQMPVSAPCIRCVVPGVSPVSGEVNGALPPAVAQLSGQRFPGSPSIFGVYAAPTPGTQIRLGERLWLELAF